MKILALFIATIFLGIGIGLSAHYFFDRPGFITITPSPVPMPSATLAPILTPTPIATASSSASPSAKLHPLKKFFVSASDYKFIPNIIQVKNGDEVQINLKVIAGLHNISIPAYNVFSPQITGGQTAQVDFIVDEKGEFEMYCDVEDHQQKGMIGKLIVE